MTPISNLSFCCLALLLTGCGEQKLPPATGPTEVNVIRVEAKNTPVSYEYTGQTESSRLVEIRTRVAGFLDRRSYREGEIVRQGQVLFQIDRKPFEAQLAAAKGQLSAQQASLAVAQSSLARVRPLAEQNALSPKDLDNAIGQERSALAAVEVARANVLTAELNLGYTTLRSPLTGLAGSAKVQDGTYLGATGQDSLLTTVAALDPMRVTFSVSENELLKHRDNLASGGLSKPADGSYLVEIILADGTVFPQQGRITYADTSFGQSTGTLLLRAEVANPAGALKPGQFVRVRLLGDAYPNGIEVPQRAVQQSGQGYFVWVVGKDSKAQPRPVKVGQWIGEQWLILGGLSSGETVVTDGLLRLAPGAPVKIAEKPAAPASPPAAK